MTRAPPFLPFFWSVYLADAREFTSPAQDGVVLLLMIAIWQAGGSLPFNKKKLAQITRQTPEQWQAMWPLIRTHFRRHSGSVSHDGVTAGLENYWARARARGAGQVPKPRQVRAKS
ncbi:MAG TPA: hypothetical protein VKQ70_00525, partial [Caulobacteraceae bacterium]|nr:hypothetical protein [Caulobacteraceae bacterium]